ncbi:MAG: hypothetical protein II223_07015 [Treponema sp.]|nr:hypothetical protein [Treponema sp.]
MDVISILLSLFGFVAGRVKIKRGAVLSILNDFVADVFLPALSVAITVAS